MPKMLLHTSLDETDKIITYSINCKISYCNNLD